MTLATKNGSIIVKDGKLAENCGCCGGWYCYRESCECWRAFVATLTSNSSPAQLVGLDSLATSAWNWLPAFQAFPISDGSVSVRSETTNGLRVTRLHTFEYNGISPCRATFTGAPLVTQDTPTFPNRHIEIQLVSGTYLEIRATAGVLNPSYTNWDAITAFSFGSYSHAGEPFALASANSDGLKRVYSSTYAASIGFSGSQVVADEDFQGTVSLSGRLQNNAGIAVPNTEWSLDIAFHPLIYG